MYRYVEKAECILSFAWFTFSRTANFIVSDTLTIELYAGYVVVTTVVLIKVALTFARLNAILVHTYLDFLS